MSWVEVVGRVISVAVGVTAAAWTLSSAVRTLVIPRPERVWITKATFGIARRIAHWIAARLDSAHSQTRVLGTFAPVVLISLPVIWSLVLIIAFAGIYWGFDGGSFWAAIELSGSSLTTLGFIPAPTFGLRLVAIVEALLGLALIAVVIGFLPTLYSTFSRREVAVGRLTTRAGEPPTPSEFLIRLNEIGRIDKMGERWEEWEDWFVELGETHTTFPALVFFRSSRPGRSWLAAAETALDTAALATACHITPKTGQAETMIRSGYLALRAIADFFDVDPESQPGDHASLGVTRAEFDLLADRLIAGGVELRTDRDAAWADFAGWRVNYDQALTGLKEIVGHVPTHWGSLSVPPAEEVATDIDSDPSR